MKERPVCSKERLIINNVFKYFCFVSNTILFFLIMTAIHIYYQHNVSPNISDFSAPMGHKIFTYILVQMTLCIAASQPEKCQTRHQKDHLQKTENTECQPTLQHAINPSIQMFASPKLCKLEKIPPPRRKPPSSSPSPSKKQSHSEDSFQWDYLVWLVLGH